MHKKAWSRVKQRPSQAREQAWVYLRLCKKWPLWEEGRRVTRRNNYKEPEAFPRVGLSRWAWLRKVWMLWLEASRQVQGPFLKQRSSITIKWIKMTISWMQRASSPCRLMYLHRARSTVGRKIISRIQPKHVPTKRAPKTVVIRGLPGKRSNNRSSTWIVRHKHQCTRSRITNLFKNFKKSIAVEVLTSSRKTEGINIIQQLEKMKKKNQAWVLFSTGNNRRHHQLSLINLLGPTTTSHRLSSLSLRSVSKPYSRTKNKCWRCSYRRSNQSWTRNVEKSPKATKAVRLFRLHLLALTLDTVHFHVVVMELIRLRWSSLHRWRIILPSPHQTPT